MREQPAALEYVPDAAEQRNRIDLAHILALDRDAAAVGLDQPVREPKQGGLAGAGAADDGEEFALGDVERDVVHGHNRFRAPAAVEALADMRKCDQGWGWHSVQPRACDFTLPCRPPAGEGEGSLPRRRTALNLSFAVAN